MDFFFFAQYLTMKINSYIRPYSEEHHLETDATKVIKCHSGSDDCLVQHVLMAAKRKGKSVEWVVNCTTLLSVHISFNRWLPSSCLSYVFSLQHMQLECSLENKVLYCRNEPKNTGMQDLFCP